MLPHPAVARLRKPQAESGYRSVYRTKPGKERWSAAVRVRGRKTRIRGSASDLPHQAALHLVLWYQRRYGAGWLAALVGRAHGGRPPWRVWQLRSGPSAGGYAARVWEQGKPTELTGRRKPGAPPATFDSLGNCDLCLRSWKNPGRLLVFATRARAEAAVRAWICRRWGKAARESVWRW